MEINEIKRKNYAEQSNRLKRALKYEFYAEALVIEYAMIEDRIKSILEHCGFSIYKNGKDAYTLYENLTRIKKLKFFKDKTIRKKLPLELINDINKWRVDRNKIIHKLMITDFQSGEFRKLAIQGNDLRKQIDNKAKNIKTYMEKINKEQ